MWCSISVRVQQRLAPPNGIPFPLMINEVVGYMNHAVIIFCSFRWR